MLPFGILSKNWCMNQVVLFRRNQILAKREENLLNHIRGNYEIFLRN